MFIGSSPKVNSNATLRMCYTRIERIPGRPLAFVVNKDRGRNAANNRPLVESDRRGTNLPMSEPLRQRCKKNLSNICVCQKKAVIL
jgi:hypothetical protein